MAESSNAQGDAATQELRRREEEEEQRRREQEAKETEERRQHDQGNPVVNAPLVTPFPSPEGELSPSPSPPRSTRGYHELQLDLASGRARGLDP